MARSAVAPPARPRCRRGERSSARPRSQTDRAAEDRSALSRLADLVELGRGLVDVARRRSRRASSDRSWMGPRSRRAARSTGSAARACRAASRIAGCIASCRAGRAGSPPATGRRRRRRARGRARLRHARPSRSPTFSNRGSATAGPGARPSGPGSSASSPQPVRDARRRRRASYSSSTLTTPAIRGCLARARVASAARPSSRIRSAPVATIALLQRDRRAPTRAASASVRRRRPAGAASAATARRGQRPARARPATVQNPARAASSCTARAGRRRRTPRAARRRGCSPRRASVDRRRTARGPNRLVACVGVGRPPRPLGPPAVVVLAGVDELHPAELTHRLQHPVARRRRPVSHDGQQRLVDEPLHDVERVVAEHRLAPPSRVNPSWNTDEPAQRPALPFGEQVPGPVDDGQQRLVPVGRAAVPAAQQREPVLQAAVDLRRRHHRTFAAASSIASGSPSSRATIAATSSSSSSTPGRAATARSRNSSAASSGPSSASW